MNIADRADSTDRTNAGDRPPACTGSAAQSAAFLQDESQNETKRLLAAAREALSVPKSRVALVLRLSLLPPPPLRPHHRRIARAILEQAAQQNKGEMFELPCGDMVLLCRTPAICTTTEEALHPAALPLAFARLLQTDTLGAPAIATLWNLEQDGAALLTYVTGLVN